MGITTADIKEMATSNVKLNALSSIT